MPQLKNKLRASIDIGSNSSLLLIVEEDSNQKVKIIANEARVTGLGRELDINKKFITIAMQETTKALSEYCLIAKKMGVTPENIIVTATEASRVASNSKEFFQEINSQLKLTTNIITAGGEAYYTMMGVLSDDRDDNEMVIMDIGGASTELILVDRLKKSVLSSISLPVGSVRGTDWLKENLFDQKIGEILSTAKIESYALGKLVSVAGTMTSAGAMAQCLSDYSDTKVHGQTILLSDFISLLRKNESLSPDELKSKFPFLKKRARTIIAGMKVAQMIAEKLGANSFEISTRGLRFGTVMCDEIQDEFLVSKI